MNQIALALFERYHEYPPMLGPLEAVPAGTPEWAERLGLRIKFGVEHTEHHGVEQLIPWIELALDAKQPPWAVWPVDAPCMTPDRYFRYAARIDCINLAKLIAAYRGENHHLVRRLHRCTAEGEQVIADQNISPGRAGLKSHDGMMRLKGQGTSTAYLLRRLAREKRQDILDAYERGEFATATAAARAAGIKVAATPLERLRRDWKRASPEDRKAFLREVT